MASKSKTTVEIVELSAFTLAELYGRPVPFPVIGHAAILKRPRRKPIVIGYGGLCWRFYNSPDDIRRRCDIWCTILRPDLTNAHTLVRWGKRMLRTAAQVGETSVYCIRDEEPNSRKLLQLVGLERQAGDVEISFDDGSRRTGEVWRWQLSRQSELPSP